jgi:hypothetical protein
MRGRQSSWLPPGEEARGLRWGHFCGGRRERPCLVVPRRDRKFRALECLLSRAKRGLEAAHKVGRQRHRARVPLVYKASRLPDDFPVHGTKSQADVWFHESHVLVRCPLRMSPNPAHSFQLFEGKLVLKVGRGAAPRKSGAKSGASTPPSYGAFQIPLRRPNYRPNLGMIHGLTSWGSRGLTPSACRPTMGQ